MTTLPSSEVPTPAFEGKSFTITHFAPTAEGFTIAAEGVGRTALLGDGGLRLEDEEKEAVKAAIWDDMASPFGGMKSFIRRRELRDKLNQKREDSPTLTPYERADIEEKLKEAEEEYQIARENYLGLGKKYGLRNITPSPENSSELKGYAITIPFAMYNRFARPENHNKPLGKISEASGVAMALVTADGRLIVQHRAVEHIVPITSEKKPGNASYTGIPGASVAGLVDAKFTIKETPKRRRSRPHDVTSKSLEDNILKEGGEELGLAPEHFTDKLIVGIAHDNIKPHDEVLFLATTSLTAAEVRRESTHSKRNKNLLPEDLEEKFMDIEASPEAIEKLVADVKCPLPPTHAAVYIACGYNMVLERDGIEAANAWKERLQERVGQNYRDIDARVAAYYQEHPEAASIVPERMWNKKSIAPRNLSGYDPAYTPAEQGLPELEDELVRTGLLPETRREISAAKLFDVDGVLTNPKTKEISDQAIIAELADCLKRGEAIALNTGRSTAWVEEKIITELRKYIDEPALYQNLMVTGEKGGTWITYDETGSACYGCALGLTMSEPLKDAVAKLVSEKYGDSMFFDTSKQTMISVEMRDNHDLGEFTERQTELVKDLTPLLSSHGQDETLKIDLTTIATDVENPHVGKALGAERFIEFLKARDVAFHNAAFTAYGDSPSDAAMADELERRGLHTEFVFVGDPAKLQKSNRYPVAVNPGEGMYEDGTLAHLRSTRPR